MNAAEKLALVLLTRREHGAHELMQKLQKKGHNCTDSQAAVRTCQSLGFQSDTRFAENVYRTRVRQGYGPQRIQQELYSAHLDTDLIQELFACETEDWVERARAVWRKKYSRNQVNSLVEVHKQQQFLLYRGFSMDTIITMLRENQP